MPDLAHCETLDEAVAAARACTLCAAELPLGPRPTFRVSESARLLIISQAPGTKVHETGIPFNDASGEGGGGFQCCWTNVHVKVTIK